MTDNTDRGQSRGRYTDTQVLYMVLLALEEGLDGVRRQDLDDLLVKMIAEHWGTAGEDASPDEAEAAFAQLEPHIPEHMLTPEPQGEVPEPSTEPTEVDADPDTAFELGRVAGYDDAMREVHGEPSDARALIRDLRKLLNAHSLHGDIPADEIDALLDRHDDLAASSVTKGENRD